MKWRTLDEQWDAIEKSLAEEAEHERLIENGRKQ
jgi:hypothetical protein